jgi:cytochrome c oxidase cbb3-type subunit 3
VAFSTDPVKLAEGKQVYVKTCQVCHLDKGQGLVGPNLTDDYWLHGGDPLSIHNTVVHGVVEKGMAAWGRQLGADRVDAVVAYLMTLRGTHVEGKAPEGELWSPEPATGAETPTETAAAAAGAPAVEG